MCCESKYVNTFAIDLPAKVSFLVLSICCASIGCSNHAAQEALLELAESTPSLRVAIDDFGTLRVDASSAEALVAMGEITRGLDLSANVAIHDTRITQDNLEAVASMDMPRLTLVRCSFESGSLNAVSKNANVKILSFVRCSVSDDDARPLSSIGSVKRLSVYESKKFSGNVFNNWKVNPQLEALTLEDCPLNDAAIPGIVRSFPNLRRCRLEGTGIAETSFLQLAANPNVHPGIPTHLAPDRPSRIELMKKYNERYSSLHPGKKPPYNLDVLE